ncbi:unnamed protein product [Phytomonas sp. Hart1]|nr:unnamed protein product [Phytomonas sp. Hart1]|eukprot:CCW72018.1 unnamed protein product [Phytomonas sp. isolate Hart1]
MVCDSFAFLGYTKRWYIVMSCVAGAMCSFGIAILPAKESSANTAGALIFLTSYFKANVDILSEGFYSRLIIKQPDQGPALVSWVWWFVLVGNIISSMVLGPLGDNHIPQVGVYISMVLQLLTIVVFIYNWYGEKPNREERADDVKYRCLKQLTERNMNEIATTNHREFQISDNDTDGALQKPLMDDKGEELKRNLLSDPIPCCFGLFEMNKDIIVFNWRALTYAVILTIAVVVMIICNIFSGKIGLLIACSSVSIVCCGASFWALPLAIAKVNVFGYLQSISFILLPGAINTFYMTDAKCLPNGPHFSYTFYNGFLAVFSNVGALLGVLCFSHFFPKVNYRLAFILPTIGIMFASLIDITIVKRWNIKIGIPDHFLYLFSHSVVVQILIKLQGMPMFVLLSRLCPCGSECLVYALLSGFTSLGRSGSTTLGAIIMEFFLPIKTKVPCDYSNMPLLILICHGIAPSITIPFIFLLIPSARICDNLDINGHVVKDKVNSEVIMRREPLMEDKDKQTTKDS